MLWYAVATLMMGFQDSATGVCTWRLLAGIGLGAELVVVDCYLAEITPKLFGDACSPSARRCS